MPRFVVCYKLELPIPQNDIDAINNEPSITVVAVSNKSVLEVVGKLTDIQRLFNYTLSGWEIADKGEAHLL